MRDHEDRESDLIDLGDVSVETKGFGIQNQDVGSLPLDPGAGIVLD